MNCGTILHDSKFQFQNTGKEIDKLSIVVIGIGDCHFSLITTTQSRGKNREPGCQLTDTPPNFYLPQHSCWFREETWILLNSLHEYANYAIDAKRDGKILSVFENKLEKELIRKILECASKSPDLDKFDKGFIDQALKNL